VHERPADVAGRNSRLAVRGDDDGDRENGGCGGEDD
jgi:hypothetical protein